VLVYVNKKIQNLEICIRKNKKASGEDLYYFFHVPLTLLYTITSSWCGRFDTPCILILLFYNVHRKPTWLFYLSQKRFDKIVEYSDKSGFNQQIPL
jgi:hypothetical protein